MSKQTVTERVVRLESRVDNMEHALEHLCESVENIEHSVMEASIAITLISKALRPMGVLIAALAAMIGIDTVGLM